VVNPKTGNWLHGYDNYATIARSLGLTACGFWSSLKDWPHMPHVQMRASSIPAKVFSLDQIDREMRNRFAG